MTAAPRSTLLRWSAPVVVAGVVAAAVAVPRLADASDDVDGLAPRSAAELLAAVSRAEVDGLSGTVVTTVRSGLPELPRAEGGSAVALPGLLSGSTTTRVWKAGEDRSRLAVVAPFAEYDVVRDGPDVWTYDSASKQVTHLVLPAGSPEPAPSPLPSGAATPEDAARGLLSLVEPSTTVTVGRAAEVAGRAAYELVLDPAQQGTLVGTVRIAVDGETSVPLRVQVFAEGATEPALQTGFTAVSFEDPGGSVFDFAPPAGAEVVERSLEGLAAPREDGPAGPAPAGPRPVVSGEGWTSVVELTGVTVPEQAQEVLGQLSEPVPGGRVVKSALLTVLLLEDGRVLAGAVPADALVQRSTAPR